MNIIVIIQARMGSTRLPGKILMPLGQYSNLDYVTSRCKVIKGVSQVVVATSTLTQDDAVEKWCHEHGVACYRGSEDDVLSRYIGAAKPYSPDYVIRVTADCPFVDIEVAEGMIELIMQDKTEFVDLAAVLPRGVASEIISYQALQYIDKHGLEPRHREHVTYYANEYKEQFTRSSYLPPARKLQPHIRITLDTPEDYELLETIGRHFNDRYVSTDEVIAFLLEHPNLIAINGHIEQKPVQ